MVRHYRGAHLAVDGLRCVQSKDNENYPFCYSNSVSFELEEEYKNRIGFILQYERRLVGLASRKYRDRQP